jgi:hypothetical protein
VPEGEVVIERDWAEVKQLEMILQYLQNVAYLPSHDSQHFYYTENKRLDEILV